MIAVPFVATVYDRQGNAVEGAAIELRSFAGQVPVVLKSSDGSPIPSPATDANGVASGWVDPGTYDWRSSKGGTIGDWLPFAAAAPPQVFEITDLTLPAGTDWTWPNPHAIADAEIPWHKTLMFGFTLELAEIPANDDEFFIGGGFGNAGIGNAEFPPPNNLPIGSTHWQNPQMGGITYTATSIGGPTDSHAWIWTGAALTAEATIVRARASFVVF